MIYIKRWNKDIIFFAKSNIIFLIVYLIIVFVAIYIQSVILVNDILFNGTFKACFADYFIIPIESRMLYFIIFPYLTLLINFFVRETFMVNRVIRYTKLRSVWNEHVWATLLFSMFTTIYFQLISSFIGAKQTSILMNFNEKKSFFAFATQGITTKDITLFNVIVITTIFLFLTIWLLSLFFTLLLWFFRKFTWCFAIIIVFALLDLKGYGLFSFFGVYYDQLLSYRLVRLIIPIVFIMFLYSIGLHYCKFREFVNEN